VSIGAQNILHDLALAGFHLGFDLAQRANGAHLLAEAEYDEPGSGERLQTLLNGWQPGRWDLAETLVQQGFRMHRRVLERSRVIVVHSEYARNLINDRYPWLSEKVDVIRIPAEPSPIRHEDRRQARQRLGLSESNMIFGSLGILHPTKQNRETIQAFSELVHSGVSASLVFAGQDLGHGEAFAEADRLGIRDRIHFLGHCSEQTYRDVVSAIDVGICLRKPPTNGESSASLLDLLSAGVPTIVSDVGTFSELPDNTVWKLPVHSHEGVVVHLRKVMQILSEFSQAREQLQQGSLTYVARKHSLTQFVDAYRRLIEADFGSSLPITPASF